MKLEVTVPIRKIRTMSVKNPMIVITYVGSDESAGTYFKTLPVMFPRRLTRKMTTKTVNPRGSMVIMPAKNIDLIPLRKGFFFCFTTQFWCSPIGKIEFSLQGINYLISFLLPFSTTLLLSARVSSGAVRKTCSRVLLLIHKTKASFSLTRKCKFLFRDLFTCFSTSCIVRLLYIPPFNIIRLIQQFHFKVK